MAQSIRVAAAATATLILGFQGAHAADQPIYIEQPVIEYSAKSYARFDCAVAFMQTPDVRAGKPERHFIEKNGGKIEVDDGWSCDVGVGHYVHDNVRVDVTLEYRGQFEVDGQADPSVAGSLSQRSDIHSFVTMFNGYWDIGTYHGITPYVGAGIGFAHNMLDDVRVDESGFETDGGTNTDFAWALMAGASVQVAEDVAIDAGYRYINFGDVASGTQGSDGSIVPPVRFNDLEAHEFRVGVRMDFY